MTLRVALCHTRYTPRGGSEAYICSLVERLLDAGHRVEYFCRYWREAPDHPRLTFHRIGSWRWPRYLKAWSFAEESRKALQAAEQEQPFDLIHGFAKNGYYSDLYRDGSGTHRAYRELYLDRIDRGPLARLWHRLGPYDRTVERIEELRYRRGAQQRVIAISHFVRDQILKRHPIDPQRVEVLYSGVDCEDFRPDRRAAGREKLSQLEGYRRPERTLLFLGNDYTRKGLMPLLEGLSRLETGEGPARDYQLVVTGRDSSQWKFEQEAAALGLAERALFTGPRKDAPELLAAADALVLPSHFEAFGNVYLEALASGTPIIASPQAGGSEVVEPGRNGWVLEAVSGEACARAVEGWLDMDDLQPLREAARASALEYRWDDHFVTLLERYQVVAEELRQVRG